MITHSTYTEGAAQVDGRRWVTELHTLTGGDELRYEWLGAQDAAMVVSARAALLNRQYAEQAAAAALVMDSLIPLTKLEFRNLFGDKKIAVDAFNATYESSALSDEHKAAIRSGLEDFKEAKHIERPFRPEVALLLSIYEAVGILTPEDKAAILGAGNG